MMTASTVRPSCSSSSSLEVSPSDECCASTTLRRKHATLGVCLLRRARFCLYAIQFLLQTCYPQLPSKTCLQEYSAVQISLRTQRLSGSLYLGGCLDEVLFKHADGRLRQGRNAVPRRVREPQQVPAWRCCAVNYCGRHLVVPCGVLQVSIIVAASGALCTQYGA